MTQYAYMLYQFHQSCDITLNVIHTQFVNVVPMLT
jgi:hypothetical protein